MKKLTYITIVLALAFILLPYSLKAESANTGGGVSGSVGTTFSVQGSGDDDDDDMNDDKDDDRGSDENEVETHKSTDDDNGASVGGISVSTEAGLKSAVKGVSDDELKKLGIERATEVQTTTGAGLSVKPKPNFEIHGLGRDAIERLSEDARKVLFSLDIKPEAIASSDDLKLFISSKIAKNSKIETVDTTENSTEIDYKSDAKVLGFIPVHMKSKIMLDANGNVTVKMPWYKAFVSKKWKLSGDTVKAELDQVGLTAEQQAQLQLSLEARAKAIETISELLKKMDETASGVTQNLK